MPQHTNQQVCSSGLSRLRFGALARRLRRQVFNELAKELSAKSFVSVLLAVCAAWMARSL